MGANVEAVIVSQKLKTITRKEVTCTLGGLPTAMPALGPSSIYQCVKTDPFGTSLAPTTA